MLSTRSVGMNLARPFKAGRESARTPRRVATTETAGINRRYATRTFGNFNPALKRRAKLRPTLRVETAQARAARAAGLFEYCRTTAITCSGLISDRHSSLTSRQQRSVVASISPPMHGAQDSLERKTMCRSFRGTSCSGSVGPKIEITRGTRTASARCSVEVSLVMNN